jgi:flagellar biogenesis protein FliO
MIPLLLTSGIASAPPESAAEVLEVGSLVARVAVSLGLVLGLLALLFLLYRKFGGRSAKGPGGVIQVAAQRSLGRNAWVALVEIEGRRILVGVTPHRLSRLGSWSEAPAPARGLEGPGASEFPEKLQRSLGRLRSLGLPRKFKEWESAVRSGEENRR